MSKVLFRRVSGTVKSSGHPVILFFNHALQWREKGLIEVKPKRPCFPWSIFIKKTRGTWHPVRSVR